MPDRLSLLPVRSSEERAKAAEELERLRPPERPRSPMRVTTTPGLFGHGYDTLDDAGAAASWAAARQPRVEGQEYMGLLVKDPSSGLFYRTDMQTQGDRHRSAWTGSVYGDVAGAFHNHPVEAKRDPYPQQLFSPTDMKTAIDLGPMYLAAIQDDGGAEQLRQTPERAEKFLRRDPLSPARGEQYLAKFPVEEWRVLWDRAIKNVYQSRLLTSDVSQ